MEVLFEKFKKITKEEEKILAIIKKEIKIDENTTILDIGSNKGVLSKAIQPNKKKITLIDIQEFNHEKEITFIKSAWESAEIKEKYDLILASHVWGHFGYTNTQEHSFKKMTECVKENGKIILVYNTNSQFMKSLIDYAHKTLQEFQYDYFNEQITKKLPKKETIFSVTVKATTFTELTNLLQILLITENTEYTKQKGNIESFLKKTLTKPEFNIEQKVVMIAP